MQTFLDWMIHHDVAAQLRLLEAAEFFNPADYNPVFEAELEKLLDRVPESEAREQALAMQGFDWGNYIARSLLRAGFKDDDQQEAFHTIAVKLLVSPGKLFQNWKPGKHGPLDRRFRKAVWNSIRNLAELTRNRRRRMVATDPVAMAERLPGRQPYSDLIDEFRQVVGDRLGKLALAILDAKLAGEDAKTLVGNPSPSLYQIKRETTEIKRLAERFAAQLGDPAFANMVAKAMEAEAETVAKRQQSMAAHRLARIYPGLLVPTFPYLAAGQKVGYSYATFLRSPALNVQFVFLVEFQSLRTISDCQRGSERVRGIPAPYVRTAHCWGRKTVE